MCIVEWWNEQHRNKNRHYLTGTSTDKYVEFLGIDLSGKKKILEIGVGLGIATKELAAMGHEVTGWDISEVALANAAEWLTESYRPHEYHKCKSNKFDLAICYLVAQHMNDNDLSELLHQVCRVLKSTGMLAIQFADGPVYNAHTAILQRIGGCLRSNHKMSDMAKEAGFEIILDIFEKNWEHTDNSWKGYWLRRQE